MFKEKRYKEIDFHMELLLLNLMYLMMAFRLLPLKHHNLLNQHLLRRAVEILLVFQGKEEKKQRERLTLAPEPEPVILSTPALEPVVISPSLLESIHETKINLNMKLNKS